MKGKGKTMAGLTTWKDLKDRHWSAEEQAQMHKEAMADLREDELRELRRIAGMNQEEVAAESGFDHSEFSRIVPREDRLLSTLRRYVEALGGDLEVVAVIGNHRVRLQSAFE